MASEASPLQIDERTLLTSRGPRVALMLWPSAPITLGAARLAELRTDLKRATVDQQIVREIKRRRGRVQMLIFRGVGPNGAAWRFDPALSDDDAEELGYLLTKSQLPTWRRLAVSGVHLHLHTDWGVRESGTCRRGAVRLRHELTTGTPGATARFDAYMLSYLSLFYSADLDHVLRDLLPNQLGLVEQRAARIHELIADLGRDAIA